MRILRAGRFLTCILVLEAAVLCLSARSQRTPAAKEKPRLAQAIHLTLQQGHDAVLPPHISHLLGISPNEQPVPVKQFVQVGERVRGFDVCAAKHDDIVIFVEEHSAQKSTFYLTSWHAELRKVLSVVSGVGYERAPTAADRQVFAKEAKFWIDSLIPKPAVRKNP